MKNILITLVVTLSTTSVFAQKNVETVEIQTSAVCDMCKETIEKQLAFTKGVTSAELNLETFVVTVSFKKNKTSVEEIRKAINAVGYDADESPAPKEAYDKLHGCCKKDAH
ncbi:MAG: heavy metal-associated domain-containing protein [Flavobacteriales bacterium]|nr:heavy metal-associated domain-containing protein [Flavobacteriales bacterium]